MQRSLKLLVAVALAASLSALPAVAHAFLDHAVPGVGTTVNGPIREIGIDMSGRRPFIKGYFAVVR